MFVRTIIKNKDQGLINVAPTDLAKDVAKVFKHKQIGFALVRDHKRHLVGTISERDIIHGLADRGDLDGMKVFELLTSNVVMCNLDDTLETVREIMTTKRTRHVLVMEQGAIMGIVSIGDLIKHSLNECRMDTTEMVDYINGDGYH